MSTTSEKLWLHMYSGRENGLMVVGSASALHALGQNLLAASPDTTLAPKGWPPHVVSIDVDGPYKDVANFKLSFHLHGESPLKEIVPLKNGRLNFSAFFAMAFFGIIGLKGTLQWLISLLP